MTELLRRRSAPVILLIAATFLVLPVAALAAAGPTVKVTDDAYDDGTDDPARTVVQAGETVTWRWSADNSKLHTVTALDGSFDSDSECAQGSTAPCRGPGNVFEVRFDEPGTYRYRCRVVLTMTGTVEVVESDGVAPPGPEPSPDPPPVEDGDDPEEHPDDREDGAPGPEDGAPEGDSPQEPDDAGGAGEADGADGPEPEPADGAGGSASPAPTAAAGGTSSPAPRRGTARARQLPQLRSEGADAGGDEVGDDPDVAPKVDRPSFAPFPEPTPAEDDELAAMAVEIPGTPDGPSRTIVTGAAIVSLLVSAGAVTKVVLGGVAA